MDEGTGEIRTQRLHNEDRGKWEELFRPMAGRAEVAVEATGNWMWLTDLLEELGAEVHLAHPGKVRLIAESRNKNDKVDAETLLMLLRSDFLPEAYLARPELREQRKLLRLRQGLVRMRTEVKNRLHALLGQHNLSCEETDLFGKRGRAFLEAVELSAASDTCRKVWLEVLDALGVLIRRMEEQLYRSLAEDPRAEILQSLPGVGKLTAYLLLAEIGPIERFSRPEKLVGYAGLCPSTRESAEKVHHGRVGPAGRAYLKWALVEAAHTAARRDPYFAKIHARLRVSKGNGKATVAVARKMTWILWHMLRENRPYIPKEKKDSRVGSTAPVAASL
jgi:transposase